MKIKKSDWIKVQHLAKKKPEITRREIGELLFLPDNTARFLRSALDNREILQFQEEEKTIKGKELILADLHIPFHDETSTDIALEYAKEKGVNTIVILGDLIDFYEISTFVKDRKKDNTKEEIDKARIFLIMLRNNFPNAEIIYKSGNHEDRLLRFILKNALALSELLENLLEEKLKLKELNIAFETEKFRIGKLWHIHGHEIPSRSANVEYITNVVWKYIYNNCVVGHWHRTQDKIFKNISGKYYGVHAIGYLAKELDYAPINNWNKGFAIVEYDQNGYYSIENKRIINGKVM